MKILFIGNSHTFVHYVPARFVQFCRDHGVQAEAVMLTHPGMGLDWHLKQSQTYYNLMCGGYDAVVLQHNAHPFPGRESLLEAGEAIDWERGGDYVSRRRRGAASSAVRHGTDPENARVCQKDCANGRSNGNQAPWI